MQFRCAFSARIGNVCSNILEIQPFCECQLKRVVSGMARKQLEYQPVWLQPAENIGNSVELTIQKNLDTCSLGMLFAKLLIVKVLARAKNEAKLLAF